MYLSDSGPAVNFICVVNDLSFLKNLLPCNYIFTNWVSYLALLKIEIIYAVYFVPGPSEGLVTFLKSYLFNICKL